MTIWISTITIRGPLKLEIQIPLGQNQATLNDMTRNTNRIAFLSLLFIWNACSFHLVAQSTTVDIDFTVRRTIGGESTLERSKYFTMHSTGGDNEHNLLYQNYNVTRSGRGFWTASAVAKQKTGQVGVFPSFTPVSDGEVREVSPFIATDHPRNVYKEGIDIDAAADWAVEYYKNEVGVSGRPLFFEPMNEPFVHARDFYDEPDWTPSAETRVRGEMARLFGAMGEKIHAAPELAKMKVLGYSSAYPALEINDFSHWNSNMKMFMDVAGPHMDGLATHIYDGINVTGQDSKRSGSNSEAILDLIETYSYAIWDSIKPHAITEYGGIEKGYPEGYSDVKSIQSIKSINHVLFNLLERQDRLLISIPFITGKAEWHINSANNYQPYGAVLWKPTNVGVPVDQIQGWEYTSRIHFYDLWKDVKGERVLVKSDNPDIQAQAFVDGRELYIALNNLDDNQQAIDLNMLKALPNLIKVNIKSLKIYKNDDPIFSNLTFGTRPENLTLIPGETTILAYTFAEPVSFENNIHTDRYYTAKHLQSISANTDITFDFDGVDSGTGFATLKMGIGRNHSRSKTPEIKVNGVTIAVPNNWKGYNQADRDDFFGMIDIPFPMSLLQVNNTVSIRFPDAGGRISSLILEVDKYETPVVTAAKERNILEVTSVYPNPVQDQLWIKLPTVVNGPVTVSFLDINGRNIMTRSDRIVGDSLAVGTSAIPSGIYLLQVLAEGKVYVGKVDKH